MSSKMYEHLLIPLCETHGFRCVAMDRRGFGNSDWTGLQAEEALVVDYNTFTDDLVHVLKGLKTESGFVFVGASMGCGEAVRAFMRSEYIREQCKVSHVLTRVVWKLAKGHLILTLKGHAIPGPIFTVRLITLRRPRVNCGIQFWQVSGKIALRSFKLPCPMSSARMWAWRPAPSSSIAFS